MAKHRFYVPQSLHVDDEIILDEHVSRHISSALRMSNGQTITLFTGQGGEFEAEITEINKKHVSVRIGIHVEVDRESPVAIHVALAFIKGERMDYAVQKLTEAGASQITPLFTERSEVKLKQERIARKMFHWQGVIISACEQCGRNLLPVISPPTSFQDFVAKDNARLKLILSPGSSLIKQDSTSLTEVTLVSGPEGGFTTDEVAYARTCGFHSTGLGPRIFRAETAPLAAVSIIQYLWGDFGG